MPSRAEELLWGVILSQTDSPSDERRVMLKSYGTLPQIHELNAPYGELLEKTGKGSGRRRPAFRNQEQARA